jgi:hypothetical protein
MRRRLFAFTLYLLGEKTGGRDYYQQRGETRTKDEAEGWIFHWGNDYRKEGTPTLKVATVRDK